MATFSDCTNDSATMPIVWISWTAASGTAATSDGNTWIDWIDCAGTATSNSASNMWIKWTNDWTYEAPRELTAEQKAERVKQAAEAAKKAEEEKQRLETAKKRSRELLVSALSTEQVQQFEKKGAFRVEGSNGGIYEIECSKVQHNIWRCDHTGRRVEELCVHLRGDARCPDSDHHLAQKLALETDEDSLRRIANKWDRSASPRPSLVAA